jgi:hypothetical protein
VAITSAKVVPRSPALGLKVDGDPDIEPAVVAQRDAVDREEARQRLQPGEERPHLRVGAPHRHADRDPLAARGLQLFRPITARLARGGERLQLAQHGLELGARQQQLAAEALEVLRVLGADRHALALARQRGALAADLGAQRRLLRAQAALRQQGGQRVGEEDGRVQQREGDQRLRQAGPPAARPHGFAPGAAGRSRVSQASR